jgi:hypothetical protein
MHYNRRIEDVTAQWRAQAAAPGEEYMSSFSNDFEIVGEHHEHIALHADALLALVADSRTEIKVVDIQTKTIRSNLPRKDSDIVQAKFSLNGNMAFVRYADKTISVYDLENGQASSFIAPMAEKVVTADFNNDGERLLIVGENGAGFIYSSDDHSEICHFQLPLAGEISRTSFVAGFMDDDNPMVGALEKSEKYHRPTLRLFYPGTGSDRVVDLSISPRRFEGHVKLKGAWNSSDSHAGYSILGFNRGCSCMAISGASIFQGMGGIGDVDLIDPQTGEWVSEQEPGVGRRWKSAFSADGKLNVVLDIIDTGGKALVYDVVTGRKLHHIETRAVEMGVASGGSCLVSVFSGVLNGKRNDKAASYIYGLRYSILNLS